MKDVAIVIPTLKYEDAKETVECLKSQTVPVDILVVDEPKLNIAEARNKGIEEAKSEIIGFTDDDCFPHKDWVEKAIRNFGPHTIAGVEGETYGGLKRIYPWGYMSCNIFYRRDILEEVGGFDTNLAGWRDDTDLAWRILKKGYRIEYEPEAKVHHPSEPRSKPKRWNDLILLKRYPLKFIKNEIIRKPISIARRRIF